MNSWIDFKYACRLLAKKPSFSVITVLIMAVGLGLCIYNYSFIYNVALKELPFKNADRMYAIDKQIDGNLYNGPSYDYHSYRELAKSSESFEILGFFQEFSANVSGGDRAVRYEATRVKPVFFDFVSTQPALGRALTESDGEEGAKAVTLVSHNLWQNYFGGMQDIVGHRFFVNGEETEIVGVMPPGFAFPMSHDLWLPSQLQPSQNDAKLISVALFGLIKPGINVDQANLELINAYKLMAQADPDNYGNSQPVMHSYPMSFMGSGSEAILMAMFIAVGFVLLLASVNVANLLYARANERAKETAIRVALGAPSSRLIMQMMWESLIICLSGGVLAILLAQVGLEVTAKIVTTFVPDKPPFYWDFSIDPHILTVSLVLIVVTAIVTGLLPAWKIISGDFNQVLRDGTRGAQSRSAGRISKVLVIFEVALSCALLTTAAMISMSSLDLKNTDYGINTNNMLTARIGLPTATYATAEEQTEFFNRLIEDLRAQPEVDTVIAANPLPGDNAWYRPIETQEFEKTRDNSYPRANSVEMYPGSFEGLDIQLLQGRYFTLDDDMDSQRVAIVTRSFVEQYWPDVANPVGRQLRYVANEGQDDFEWMTVVGVVEHVVHGQPYVPWKHYPTVYAPMAQDQYRFISVGLNGKADPMALVTNLSSSLSKLDANVPAFRIKPYADVLKRNVAGMSFVSDIFNLFAVVALILAATGIYGVIANSVQMRTQELGVRRALGGDDSNIVVMLMKQGWWQLLIGVALGLPLAYLLGNNMINFIGVKTTAVYSMLLVMPLLIALVVSLATFFPAKRAVSCEPSVALRYE